MYYCKLEVYKLHLSVLLAKSVGSSRMYYDAKDSIEEPEVSSIQEVCEIVFSTKRS